LFFSESQTGHTNTVCGKNTELAMFKSSTTYSSI